MKVNTIATSMPTTVRNNNKQNTSNSKNPKFGMRVDITKNLKDYLLAKTTSPDDLFDNLQKLEGLSNIYRGLKVVLSRGRLNPFKPLKVTCMVDNEDEIAKANHLEQLLAPSHTDRYFINKETIPCNYRFEDVSIDPAWPDYGFEEYPHDYLWCVKSCADKLLEKSHKLYDFESDYDIEKKIRLLSIINPDLEDSPAKEKFNDAVNNSIIRYRKQEIQEKLKGI